MSKWWGRLTDQRGSMAPMILGVLVVVLGLSMALIDREWVNYVLKITEQNADLAAEAGAAHRTVQFQVSAKVSQYYFTWDPQCMTYDLKTGTCTAWETVAHVHWTWDKWTRTAPEADFRKDWRAVLGCTKDNPLAPSWKCESGHLDDSWIVFDPEATSAAHKTFTENWLERAGVHLTDVQVWLGNDTPSYSKTPDPAFAREPDGCPKWVQPTGPVQTCRKVYVLAKLQLKSLFGLFGPIDDTVVSSTVAQIKPWQPT